MKPKKKKTICLRDKKLLSALLLTTNYLVLNRIATKEQSQWKKKLHFYLFEPDEK